jgi:pimeloyl-ACP methyl ester carboxylesterase
VISGASVSGTDGLGWSFNVVTGSAGYVMITGNPGTWNFNLSAPAYNSNSWSQTISATGEKHAFLTPNVIASPTPTPTPSPTPTATPSATATPRATATPTATASATPVNVSLSVSKHAVPPTFSPLGVITYGSTDDPLTLVTNENTLKAQPIISEGLVADGVTPILLEFDSSPAPTQPIVYKLTATITGGSILDEIASHIRVLQHGTGDSFVQGDSIVLSPGHPNAFAYIAGIKSESVQLQPPNQQLYVNVIATPQSAFRSSATIAFKIRRPPIVLVHGYNSDNGTWSSDFLNVLRETNSSDFVIPVEYGATKQINAEYSFEALAPLLDANLRAQIESPLSSLHQKWTFIRYDAVGHSQGGMLLRMLCTRDNPSSDSNPEFRGFTSLQNANRGRFHRVITIGSPHLGSTALYYLLQLKARDPANYLVPVLAAMDLLQDKFDPFGSQIREINVDHWHLDPSAKLHLIATSIYGGRSPGIAGGPPCYMLAGLTFPAGLHSVGSVVLPDGSDGVVNGASQLSGNSLTAPTFNETVITGIDISHASAAFKFSIFGIPVSGDPTAVFFGLAAASNTDTQSNVVASKVVELLTGDSSRFGTINLEPLGDEVRRAIDGVVPFVVAIDIIRALLPAERTNSSSESPATNASIYRFSIPAGNIAAGTDPVWTARVSGPAGITSEGISITPDPTSPNIVSVTVDDSVVGDVILSATYGDSSGNLVTAKPVTVVSRPPGAAPSYVQLIPEQVSAPVGSNISLQLWANYANGSRSQMYVPPDAQIVFRSSDEAIATVDSNGTITLHSVGEVVVSVAYLGFAAESHITVAAAPGGTRPAGKLANISTRLKVELGDNALIGGFIITGTQPKTVIVRGIGPSLAAFGIQGVLDDPTIEVYDAGGVLRATNDNWGEAETRQQIIDSGLAPTHNLESALWGVINPGAYTVVVRGKGTSTGVGLFEVYDLDETVDSKLSNISTRGFVDTDNNVMIGGTIITGTTTPNVLFRAVGPSLGTFGVNNALQDPILELHDGNGGVIAINDNWRDSQEAAITATGIPPTDNRESAILANLAPGAYTAIVRGAGNTTGVALVEAYQLP